MVVWSVPRGLADTSLLREVDVDIMHVRCQ